MGQSYVLSVNIYSTPTQTVKCSVLLVPIIPTYPLSKVWYLLCLIKMNCPDNISSFKFCPCLWYFILQGSFQFGELCPFIVISTKAKVHKETLLCFCRSIQLARMKSFLRVVLTQVQVTIVSIPFFITGWHKGGRTCYLSPPTYSLFLLYIIKFSVLFPLTRNVTIDVQYKFTNQITQEVVPAWKVSFTLPFNSSSRWCYFLLQSSLCLLLADATIYLNVYLQKTRSNSRMAIKLCLPSRATPMVSAGKG